MKALLYGSTEAHLSLLLSPHRRTLAIHDMAFANASNFRLENAQFNAIANQTNINYPLTGDSGKTQALLCRFEPLPDE